MPRVRFDDRIQVLFLGAVHMERAHRTAALDKGKNDVFVSVAAPDFRAFLATDKGLVDLDNLAFAAHRLGSLAGRHRLAHAVRHEPCRTIRANAQIAHHESPKHTQPKLTDAEALLVELRGD